MSSQIANGLKELSLDAKAPAYIQHRISLFEKHKASYDAWVALQPRKDIQVVLPDGLVHVGRSWETTPLRVAAEISKELAGRLVIAKVDGELWDSTRPLEKDCKLELLDFEHPEGKQVFWHSSAHVLGEACEGNLGCHLCIGPPIEEGFYYEMRVPQDSEKDLVYGDEAESEKAVLATAPAGKPITPSDYPSLNVKMQKVLKERQPFERLELNKEQLLEMFQHNPFKQHLIRHKIPDGERTTVYRCGPLIDLCRGPHVPHTGRIGAIQVTRSSSSYFLGDQQYASLQRVYGISFPQAEQLAAYLKEQEEADRRDHRRIGKEQQLFFFHEFSPGCAFFLPHGARIYNKLVEFLRSEYVKRGFTEVHTPNLFNVNLWKQSGHWDNYRENMFAFHADAHGDHSIDNLQQSGGENGTIFALKPMNCPGHCLMFGHKDRSYRDLPIRFADFGVLHRNELSGTLGGLTRVRRFQQDDAHIFCRHDQIEDEIAGCLDFLKHVYSIFGFEFSLVLSTRPEKYLGSLEQWEKAESQLSKALDEAGMPWQINPADGAFYGPKIDISIQDAHKRRHQCATIQLDFQLPLRFGLEYQTPEGTPANPVIIHRAILGSLERQFAILTEHFSGDWPLWLSPRQIAIIPVSAANFEYAEQLAQKLSSEGFYADADLSSLTLSKKVRNAELAPYKFILVVGAKETAEQLVNVRKASLDGKDVVIPLNEFVSRLRAMLFNKSRSNLLE